MNNDYDLWKQRWDECNIGFHQSHINADLKNFIKQYKNLGQTVLVPLCGKSLDMLFLRDCAYAVLGVEFYEQAILDFFSENNLSFEKKHIEVSNVSFDVFVSDKLCIAHMSCFDLNNELLETLLKDLSYETVGWVYDRAALIALNEEQRQAYANVLNDICSKDTAMLCVTLDKLNDQSGPPFAVNKDMLLDLYSRQWHLGHYSHHVKNEALHKHVFHLKKM